MEEKKLHVLSYVRLTDRCLIVDGNVVLENIYDDTKQWISSIYKNIGMDYPKFFKMDRLCKVGTLCAEAAMRKSGFQNDDIKKNWAVICANSAGSLDDDRSYQETIQHDDNYFPSPSVFVYTLANIVTGEIAIRHKIQGESSCYVAQKFDANAFINAVSDLFLFTPAEYALAGWVDYDSAHCDVLMLVVSKKSTNSEAMTSHELSNVYAKQR